MSVKTATFRKKSQMSEWGRKKQAYTKQMAPFSDDQIVSRVIKVAEVLAGKRFYEYQIDFAWGLVSNVLNRTGAELTALFSRQCLVEDTLMLRRGGSPCRIQDFEGSWYTGLKQCYEVSAGSQTIEATLNHPFLTPDGFKKLSELRKGDFVAVMRDWDEIPSYDLFVTDVQKEGRYPFKATIRAEINEKTAAMLGYMIADGTLPTPGQSPKFTNTNEQYIREMEEIISSEFDGVDTKRYKKGKGWDLTITHPSRRFASNPFSLFMAALDWDSGFPTDMFNARLECRKIFLNRLMGADGYLGTRSKTVSAGICCGNDPIYARYIQLFLNVCGIHGRIKSERMAKSTEPFYRITIEGDIEVERLINFCGAIFGKETQTQKVLQAISARKKEVKLRGGKGRVRKNIKPSADISTPDGENFVWCRIKSITPTKVRKVYDCTIPEKHWFVAQGFAVHNSGKSEIAADISAALIIVLPFLANLFPDDPRFNRRDKQGRYRGYKYGFRIGIYAPIMEQAKTTFDRIKCALETDNAVALLKEMGGIWETNNGNTIQVISKSSVGSVLWRSRIICASASPTSNIESKTHDLLILEETQDMEDMKISKSLRPMVASTKGTITMIGTAGTQKCTFLKTILRNKRHQIDVAGDKRHYFYPAEICAQYNSDYHEFVELEKERLGEESDAFVMSYKCKFLLERGMFVTERFLLDPKVARISGPFSEIYSPETIWRVPQNFDIVAGIDFAKVSDSTVVTLMAVDWRNPIMEQWVPYDTGRGMSERLFRLYNKHVVGWLELYGDNYESQFQEILAYLLRCRRIKKITVDATGVGMPLFDRFNASFKDTDVVVQPFVFQEQNNSDAYKQLLSDIIQGRLTFPYSPEARKDRRVKQFVTQLLDAEKHMKPNGTMKVCAPEEPDAHDDYCDSLCLASASANEPADHRQTICFSGLQLYRR